MDRDTLVSLVVEEVLRALKDRPAGQQGAPGGTSCPSDGNAKTRAGIYDYSQGTASRVQSLERSQDASAALDRPAAIVGISNRHIHLCPEHCARLFGPGRDLTIRNELRQPGEYAARETVTLISHRGRSIEGVRILGPLRKATQVELSRTDCFYLGVKAPVRPSGRLDGTPGII
ncbi:MAG: PduL/EutD family phosphate acyltransferase, partial [Candidatus Sumerlaeota bacterium]|nr:PduL/EutD family phosphate acyltransferase [Candidatus Sumerlaeota bacterium]